LSLRNYVEGSFFHCMENHSLVLMSEIHGNLMLILRKCGSILWDYAQLISRKIHAQTSLYNALHHVIMLPFMHALFEETSMHQKIWGISCDHATIHAFLIRGDMHWTLQINRGVLWVSKVLFYQCFLVALMSFLSNINSLEWINGALFLRIMQISLRFNHNTIMVH